MRIGVITCWNSKDNYGQQLQCWAMQRVLRKMGHEPFLIRYDRSRPHTLVNRLKGLLTPAGITRKAYEMISSTRRKNRMTRIAESAYFEERNGLRDFQGFRKAEISLSDLVWRSIAELREDPPQADCYITGSDQVWYDSLLDPDVEGMYLAFGGEDVRRISYAASIGRDVGPDEFASFAKLVNALDHVSVREQGAADWCAKAGVETPIVLDPTLLLSYGDIVWLAQKAEKGLTLERGYLFAYILNVLDAEELRWDEAARYADERNMGRRVVYSSGYEPAARLIPGLEPDFPTVPQWVGMVRDARCVVTTSYHGVVFSILAHKPFVALPLKTHANANDRLLTLLSALGLQNRILEEDMDFAKTMDCTIDWGDVDARLTQLQSTSRTFLEGVLA